MNKLAPPQKVGNILKEACAVLGIPCWGFFPLKELTGLRPGRKFGEVEQLLETEGSCLLFALPYYAGERPGRNLSRHAWGKDYHRLALAILFSIIEWLQKEFPVARFLPLADDSPLPEVQAGVLAGLGIRGKHGQLLVPVYGSQVFLAEILTDLQLPDTRDKGKLPPPCGACTRCLEACPTGALREAGIEKSLCRSWLTQKRGSLSRWETEQIRQGGLVWGCDLCTDACPRNQETKLTPIEVFRTGLVPRITQENLEEALLGMRSYGWRGKEILRRNLAIIDEKG